jgi:hypothetical protein
LNRPVRDRPFVLGYKRRRYYYTVTRTVYDNNVDPRRCNKTSTDDKVKGTEQADQANAEESVTKLRLTPLTPSYAHIVVLCKWERSIEPKRTVVAVGVINALQNITTLHHNIYII